MFLAGYKDMTSPPVVPTVAPINLQTAEKIELFGIIWHLDILSTDDAIACLLCLSILIG